MKPSFDKYLFKEYDPRYPIIFMRERERLVGVLGTACQVEHVGSTSVPGLGGKGVIDMFVITPTTELSWYSTALQDCGYELRPNACTPQRLFHRAILRNSYGEEHLYHVHLVGPESVDRAKDTVFRDWLIANSDDRLRYEEIKRQAAEDAKGDGPKYKELKTQVMEEISRKAMR